MPSVSGGAPPAAITALNSATANELVTIGATTTELEAEGNFFITGNKLGIGTSTPPKDFSMVSGSQLLMMGDGYVDASNYTGLRIGKHTSDVMYINGNSENPSAVPNQKIFFNTYGNVYFGNPAIGTFVDINIPGIQVDIGKGMNNNDPLRVFSVADGDGYSIFTNRQAHAGSSTNETTGFRFGFATDYDVGRITVGKEADYSTGANSDSFMSFWVDINATATERMRLTTTTLKLIGIPTSDPGVAGELWNSSGDLKISEG
jgi:hypothetical protein